MVDIEKIIDYIKEARRRGFRDDTIKKKLLLGGYPELKIDDAFLGAGKPKRQDFRIRLRKNSDKQKNSVTIILDDWMRKELEKRAKQNNITINSQAKKMLAESIGIPKGVSMSRLIRKKLTEEQKERHRIANEKYEIKVRKEWRRLKGARRRAERRKRRKGLFG